MKDEKAVEILVELHNGINYRLSTSEDVGDMEAIEHAISALRERIERGDGWIDTSDKLPDRKEQWEEYNVVVMRSYWPKSSYDIVDSPYSEELVTTAKYDSEQKIWHLSWDEQLNALLPQDEQPLNGDFVTHWRPLPPPPARRRSEHEIPT